MATRFIGVDSEDPRLPQVVIDASVGSGPNDLAAGNAGGGGGSFVGAYATVDAPLASSVEVGYHYFDTTLVVPFWSDGANWVSSGSDVEPPPTPVPLTVGFTAVPDETFEPWVGLTSDTAVTWHSSTGVVLGTGIQPSFTVPANGVISMDVADESLVDFLNFGYDNTQDVGSVSLPEAFNWPPTSLTGVTTPLSEIPNIRYFMAADTELTGHLDIAGHPHLEHIECFHAHVETCDLTGCDAVVRLCFETNDLEELDLTPVRLTLVDFRAADQGGASPVDITCTGDLPVLDHYCVQGNAGGLDVGLDQMPVVNEWWVWDKGLTTVPGGTLPVSPHLSSILTHNNPWTTSTMHDFLTALADIAMANTDTAAALNGYNGTINNSAGLTNPLSAAGARAVLLSRNWTLPGITQTGDATSAGVWPAHTKDGIADGWSRLGSAVPVAVYDDRLTGAWTGYGRVIRLTADGASTTNPTFTVTADRTSFTGTNWGIFCRADSSGVNGARAMINGITGAITGIGLTNNSSTGNAVITNLGSVPAGWTDAGTHTMSMTLSGNQVTVALDGSNCYRATPSPSGGTWGGYYFGFCGNPTYVQRSWDGFTLT